MTRADVAIVGAGPAGLAAAIALRRRGIERVTVVDRYDFPRDKTCGSAVSPKGIEVLKALDLYDAVVPHARSIRGIRLVTPAGHDTALAGPDAALICNRRVFDEILLRRAQDLGVTFVPNVQAEHLLYRDDRVIGFTGVDGSSFQAGVTLVADGAKSRFALDRGPRRMLQTIMGWWDGVDHLPDRIEMFFDSLVAPLYGWLFPEGNGRINVGICYEDETLARNGRAVFQAFLDKNLKERLAAGEPVGPWKGHPISYSVAIGRLASPGRIVIGEAARITHPATGEGIYHAMWSGMAAAEAVDRIAKKTHTETEAGRAYEAACRATFALSFRAGFAWRRFVSIGGLDLATRAASAPGVRKLLARSMAHM